MPITVSSFVFGMISMRVVLDYHSSELSILFHFADVEKARFHPSSGIITTEKLDSNQNAILIKNLLMKT